MATLDFTPLFRSSIGFDHVTGLLSDALQRQEIGFPPYNIEKVGEDQYRIVMAVAGFSKADVEIVQEQNRLSVRGQLKDANAAGLTCIAGSPRAVSSASSTLPTMSRSPMPQWARACW